MPQIETEGRTIRIGTRGSPLALAQAHQVQALLMAEAGGQQRCEIQVMKTSGDRIQDRPLADIGGKGLFTKELDEALLDGRIDCAVHSMKDVATRLPDGIDLAALLPREDVRDRLVTADGGTGLADLPAGARIGTSSIRRAAQVRARRPDLEIVPFRGNVGTRLEKLEAGLADATLLAAAGLNRLGLADLGQPIPTSDMLPAPAQGAVGITVRAGDAALAALLARFNDHETWTCVTCERAFLAALDGSCRTPIAAHAKLDVHGTLSLSGQILSPDGVSTVSGQEVGTASAAAALGTRLGARLRPLSPIPLGDAIG